MSWLVLSWGCAATNGGSDAGGPASGLRAEVVPILLPLPAGVALRDAAVDSAGSLLLVGQATREAVALRYHEGVLTRERLPQLADAVTLIAVAAAAGGHAVAVGAVRKEGAPDQPLVLLRGANGSWTALSSARLPRGRHRLVDVGCRPVAPLDCDLLAEGTPETGGGTTMAVWRLRGSVVSVDHQLVPTQPGSSHVPKGLLQRPAPEGWDLLVFGALDASPIAVAREAERYRTLAGSVSGAEVLAAAAHDGGALLVGRTRAAAAQEPDPAEPVVLRWSGDSGGLRRDRAPPMPPGEWLTGVAAQAGNVVAISVADRELQPMTSNLWQRRGSSWSKVPLPAIARAWRLNAIAAARSAFVAVGERREGTGPGVRVEPLLLRIVSRTIVDGATGSTGSTDGAEP